jgi:hypothetical protein
MKTVGSLARLGWLATFLMAHAAYAHEGHDDTASVPVTVAGAPRVEATSDLFEVVGVVDRGTMTIFLDRYATNEPVVDAKIDIDAGPAKGVAQAKPDGTYTFTHAALGQPGSLPITFTVASSADTDLLTGELVIADPSAVDDRIQTSPMWKGAAWTSGALILIGAVALLWWFRRRHFSRKGIL